MQRYLIPGLGIVDVMTDLKVVPGPGGKGSHVVGTAKAWVRRLDNSFFRELTGGLPSLTTNLERGNDGIVHFTNLQLYSPKLRLSGAGQRFRDGTFHIVASGRQAKYGPLKLVLDGHIERPKLDLFLDQPERGARHQRRCTCCSTRPRPGSIIARAAVRSSGPFTSNGQILLPHDAPTIIAIASLDAGGAHASGGLRSDPGGFTRAPDARQRHARRNARLLAGSGRRSGSTRISPPTNANFPGAFSVRSGRVDGTIVLADERTTIDGVDRRARDCRRAALTLARLTANAKLVNGCGQVRAAFAGRRGAAFAFSTLADVSPDQIRLTGSGRIERQPLVLNQAGGADPRRATAGRWRRPASALPAATATVSGRSGSRPEVHAQLAAMPLEVLDIFWPHPRPVAARRPAGSIMRGRATAAAARPQGARAQPRRAGARVEADRRRDRRDRQRQPGGAARGGGERRRDRRPRPGAVRADGQRPAGRRADERAAVRAAALYRARPIRLWRLTGSEIIDMSGPLAVGADIGGRLANPVIRGSLRTQNARLESPVTGMVIDQSRAAGAFLRAAADLQPDSPARPVAADRSAAAGR